MKVFSILLLCFCLIQAGFLSYGWTLSDTLAQNLAVIDKLGSVGADILEFFTVQYNDWLVVLYNGEYYYFQIDFDSGTSYKPIRFTNWQPSIPGNVIVKTSVTPTPGVIDEYWTFRDSSYQFREWRLYENLTQHEFNKIKERGFDS